jgi:hypothetical protein
MLDEAGVEDIISMACDGVGGGERRFWLSFWGEWKKSREG